MWFVFAASAAVCFGVRGVLYQWTSRRPIDRNLMLLGVYLSGVLISLLSNLSQHQLWNEGIWWGVPMGIFSFISNASMYKGYAVGRASLIAIFTGLPPVVVVIAAYLAWGEGLGTVQLGGFIIVILGVLIIRYSQDLKLGKLQGLQWGVLTMVFFGFTDLTSKQATLAEASTLPVLTVMYGTGAALFAFQYLRAHAGKTASGGTSAETPAWVEKHTFAWGMIVGITNIAGMIFLLPAFREGVTGIVSAISAMNVVVVLLYARLYLKERMTGRETFGMLLALTGILVLRLAS